MELKNLISHFTYHIEPKPEGGFVARGSDPSAPALEAPTREELRQKIQANISAALANEFPGLKLPLQNRQVNVSFHIERKADGSFDLHSNDAASSSVQGASGEQVESHFAEKMLQMVGKHLPPEFSQGLGTQLASGNVKIFVDKNTKNVSFSVNGGTPAGNVVIPGTQATGSPADTSTQRTLAGNSWAAMNANDGSPITPRVERGGAIFRFLLAAIIVIAAMFAYLRFHH